MKSLTDTYELSNGVKIPCIGFGTFQVPNNETAIAAIKKALDIGYRHIDTAASYKNEESVGAAVKQSGISREKIFVTSKLFNTDHGYENTLAAFERTINNLEMDYIDLYLIHWPNPIKYRDCWQEANAGSWKAFEELYNAGRIRAIGISNFRLHHIDALMETAKITPMVNQIRLCPGDIQEDVVGYCKSHNIQLEAYSPLGMGTVFKVKELKDMAEKYGKSIAQICIRWSLQMGFVPLPKSVTEERIKENSEVFDFELSVQDVKAITELKGCCGYAWDPDTIEF